MGNHFEEPVILVKAAWGGHSLYKNFRSRSAGFPAEAVLQKELEQMQANVKKSNEKNKKNARCRRWRTSRASTASLIA